MIKAYYNNRYELKYVLDLVTYYKIKKDIEVLFRKDPLGGKGGEYKVISLYYDTSGLKFYWEKIDGEERRVKLRLRTYVHKDTSIKGKKENSDVFLELKKKINKNVFKKRVLIDEKKAKEFIDKPLINKRFFDMFDEKGKETLKEATILKSIFKLRPTIVVSYTREAFLSNDNLNVRVTFDSNVRYRNNDFSLKIKEGDKYVLPPNLVIMEIKYSDYFPQWIVQLIKRYNCNLQTFSKYCNGVDNLFYEKPLLGEIHGVVY